MTIAHFPKATSPWDKKWAGQEPSSVHREMLSTVLLLVWFITCDYGKNWFPKLVSQYPGNRTWYWDHSSQGCLACCLNLMSRHLYSNKASQPGLIVMSPCLGKTITTLLPSKPFSSTITSSLSHFSHTKNVPLHLGRDHHLVPVFHVDLGLPVKLNRYIIHLVYAVESATYRVIFSSCLCQRVRAFDTNKWII